MTTRSRTVLTQDDIRRIALEAGCDPERDDGSLIAQIIAFAESTVIGKLGTCEAKSLPLAEVQRPEGLIGHIVYTDHGIAVKPAHGVMLYDATALAHARQRGRSEGYDAAWAEFGPDAERFCWLIEHARVGRWATPQGHVLQIDGADREVPIDAPVREAIDAARQPTQKEAT